MADKLVNALTNKNTQELLQNIAQSGVLQNFLGNSQSVTPVSAAESAEISNAFDGIKWVFRGRIFLTFIITLWAVGSIVLYMREKDENTKKNYQFINNTIFGNLGVIPTILILWVVSVLIIGIVPAFSEVLKNINTSLVTINKR